MCRMCSQTINLLFALFFLVVKMVGYAIDPLFEEFEEDSTSTPGEDLIREMKAVPKQGLSL